MSLTHGQIVKDPYGAVRIAATRHCRKDPMPVGTVVIRREFDKAAGRHRCARYIKTRADGPSGRRWIQYSRWWWLENRGSIPLGQFVLHKDGDTLNDAPANLLLGGCAMKLVLAHRRDREWSKDQHARAAAGCADLNRLRGRENRAERFLAAYWYPVVENLSTILNVPFRRRKRLVGCFGADVSKYPANGHGKKPSSVVQKAFQASRVLPMRGRDLAGSRYRSFGILEPATQAARGPMSTSVSQLAAQLDRMGIWAYAEKYAKKDLRERR